MIKHAIIYTNLGHILVAGSERGLREVSIHKSRQAALESIAQQSPESVESFDAFADLAQRLKRYARGERIVFNETIDFGDATPFQRAVWEATRSIPYAETQTYAWIAQRIGRPGAARAVGQALRSNPFPLIVPCHRVIGADGSLTGFSAGIDLKKRLIDMEASSTTVIGAR